MWKIRKISLEDSEKIYGWRNNPEVYRYLFNPFPVERDGHNKWLASVLKNELIAFYMANYNGEDMGTIRFDFVKDYTMAEIGIYLAPTFHGKGLSSAMLMEAEKIAVNEFKYLDKIIAKVLPENIASEKMFLKSGYDKKFIQLEKNVRNK